MYQTNEKNILQKMSPHLSQNIAMAHRNYFRRNNLWILILATYTKIEDPCFSANWQLFRLERIAKCSYFILCTQNIKVYWFEIMKIKKFMLPIWWYNRGLFPLGNKYYWGLCSEWVIMWSIGKGSEIFREYSHLFEFHLKACMYHMSQKKLQSDFPHG